MPWGRSPCWGRSYVSPPSPCRAIGWTRARPSPVSRCRLDAWHSMDVEAYPPLYFVLAWPWSKMFGLSEFGLRSLSAVLGTATVPVAYAAARRLFSVRVGLFAALLVACSPLLVWYSQEARPYALLVFLSTLSLFWFVRVLDDARPADFIGWSVVSTLALLTHNFALFPVGFEAAWLLVAFRRRSMRWSPLHASRALVWLCCRSSPASGVTRVRAAGRWIALTAFWAFRRSSCSAPPVTGSTACSSSESRLQ
jgi:4-amino-4-deoxy-L-arabinose transferase-like glycosyltransferase